jgi:hypothetical protein
MTIKSQDASSSHGLPITQEVAPRLFSSLLKEQNASAVDCAA